MKPNPQTPTDEDGLPEFEPVRVYDAPATILTQIADGEGSLSRAIRTLMESESLSPQERDSYVTRLKKAYGGNSVVDTTIDVATNPLVWLLYVISPVGRRQFLATQGQVLAGLSTMRKSGVVNRTFVKLAELLRPLQLTGLISGTETQAPAQIYQTLKNRLEIFGKEEAEIVGAARAKLIAKLGVSDLDPTRASLDPTRASSLVLDDLDRVSHYWMSGHADYDPTGRAPRMVPFVSRTAVGLVHKVLSRAADGRTIMSPKIVPTVLHPEVQRDLLANGGAMAKGRSFILNGEEVVLAEDAIQVSNADTLQRARALFPSVKAGQQAGLTAESVRYVTIDNRHQTALHIVGLDRAAILRWAKEQGIESEFVAYMKANERALRHFKTRMFGKLNPDGGVPDVFELDPDKVIKLYAQWQGAAGNPEMLAQQVALQELVGPEFFETIHQLLPGWVKQEIRKGSTHVTLGDVSQVLKDYLTPQLTSPYLARNAPTLYRHLGTPGGVKLVKEGPTHFDALTRRREQGLNAEEVAHLALPRSRENVLWDPEDLRMMGEIAKQQARPGEPIYVIKPGVDTGIVKPVLLDEYIIETQNQIRKAVVRNGRGSALTMSHEVSMRKYMRDAHTTIALHSLPMPENLRPVVQGAIRTPVPKLKGAEREVHPHAQVIGQGERAEGDANRMYDEYTQLGVRTEDLPYKETISHTAPESLVVSPHFQKMGQEAELVKAQILALEQTPNKTLRMHRDLRKFKQDHIRLEEELDRLSSVTRRPDIVLLNPEDRTPLSMADMIRIVLQRESPETQDTFNKVILPALYGGAKSTHFFQLRANQNARGMATSFANSSAGKWLSANGGEIGRSFVKSAKDYGSLSGYELDAAYRSNGLVGYLYATHLGFNVSSAMWNALQPFTWAATWMGGPQILQAYGSALKQLSSYTAARFNKYGIAPITSQQRRELWEKHIRLAGKDAHGRDLLGLSHDVISNLDSAIFSRPLEGKPNLFRYILVDAPLKLFQKAEELNRIVVAEAGLKWYGRLQKESGLSLPLHDVLDRVQEMQSLVNFSPNPLTQLRIFQDGGFLSHPMLRMFLQFPARTLSNLLVGQQLGGGVRDFGVGPWKTQIPAIVGDPLRMLGMGAVVYEIGKNMLGTDLSSGVAGAAMGQLPASFLDQRWPIPPVIDIPAQLLGSMAKQDRDQFRQAAFRLLPGGVALHKALGAFPALPGGGTTGLIQSQYADWTQPNEQGQIPVYNNQGMLQGFDSPLRLLLRGIGADFKKHKSPQEATKFLLANRQEIIGMRRQYKDAVLGNNMGLAAEIEAEYKTRFGVPMTVKEAEWDRAQQLRGTAVAERMVDAMPKDVRSVYQQALSGPEYAQAMGLPVGGLEMGDTASQRKSIRHFNVENRDNLPTGEIIQDVQ